MHETKVAIMNTSKELTELLSEVLQEEGFSTCMIFTYEFKNHVERFSAYVKENKPDVILYDIGIPYVENYELFKKIRSFDLGKKIEFVLSTTNKDALEKLVGKTEVFEIIGKPYDLQQIIVALKDATRS